ncbi:MAG: DsbA family protein [Paracoccus sp. (in: a-proteobacteria)]|nr:DsbA family protein [Paracoccus sp. (in: a-proteobacteria)]
MIIHDLRILVSASLTAAALALPAAAQDAAPAPAPATQGADATATATATATETAEPQILPDLFLGAEDAPITIYEYASYTCPHCATFHREVFPLLKAEYIDTGKVRFALRDVYFDQVGLWAGIVARCNDEKFYPVSGMLMNEQSDWMGASDGTELVANLRKIAAKAGMTSEQVDVCWSDEARVESLVATFQHNATTDGINATPSFMIAGEQVSNQPWEQLKAKIDEKLAEAGAGTPAAQ